MALRAKSQAIYCARGGEPGRLTAGEQLRPRRSAVGPASQAKAAAAAGRKQAGTQTARLFLHTPVDVQFDGDVRPFQTAELDKPIVISWSGGVFELDATLALMSGTCSVQTLDATPGDRVTGTKVAGC